MKTPSRSCCAARLLFTCPLPLIEIQGGRGGGKCSERGLSGAGTARQ